VFHAPSARALAPEHARELVAAVAPFVTTVALFVDPPRADVERVIDTVRPQLLQFHGAEDETFCTSFGLPYLKAVRVGEDALPRSSLAAHASARALLLDRLDTGQAGGTGRSFDWTLVPADTGRRLILAGGLHAGNVGAGIAALRPYAVDVSSGVESAPGIKDVRRLMAFMHAVRAAQAAFADGTGEQHDELA
jgi:phosphoribosylanthranilate isomerase